mgnify:CR=1 FL=1
MFASIKKSCTFVLGLSKEVLSPINLLVISFSVINYVVRVRVHARCVDAHFFCIYPIFRYVWSLRQARAHVQNPVFEKLKKLSYLS